MDKQTIRRNRLQELVDTVGNGSITELANRIGREPSYVGRMLYPEGKPGGKAIGERMADHITKELGLPSGWLDSYDNILPSLNRSGRLITVLDVTASAGSGAITSSDLKEMVSTIEYTEEQYNLLFKNKTPNQIKVINVKGDSMSGTIESGDLVFVDVTINHFDGDGIYVFCYGEHLYIKRLQMAGPILYVISDNTNYRDWQISESEINNLYIAGKVLISQSQAFKRYG